MKARRTIAEEKPHFSTLGETPREDTAAVMRFYDLPRRFPKGVIADAEKAARDKPTPCKGRLDLRKKFIFTCDPVTARDYDDALSIETDRLGNRVLGVHIADVSHYVRPGSALDREARKRSTSVYFCDRVVPMLPEVLCNGVCSLVPDEDRYAFSAFITFNSKGEMKKTSFAKSIIRSKARFSYEQVMKVLRGGKTDGLGKLGKTAEKAIRDIGKRAAQLRARRFAAGALDIDIPEAEVVLDADGEMSGLMMRPYDESHQMVEECMVAANEAVAKELWTHGVKIMARLHEPPDEEKMEMLQAELHGMGLKVGDLSNQKVFVKFLQSSKDHPLYSTISMAVLRSMKRAMYDAGKMGHFGLAKRYYAHFTSPIRRYPDLTLHRQLAAYIEKRDARIPQKELSSWAAHASMMEERAAEAERDLLEIKKYRFMEARLGDRDAEFEAVISKCMPFGCFVDLPDVGVSGLIHVSMLSHSYVKFDESSRTLYAPGGRRWKMGDRLRVRIVNVDFRQRRIDFAPVK